jgi:hypothetical protein
MAPLFQLIQQALHLLSSIVDARGNSDARITAKCRQSPPKGEQDVLEQIVPVRDAIGVRATESAQLE